MSARVPPVRASYRQAIRWIATEDEPGYLDAEQVVQESGMTVALVADLWRKQPHHVAADVARYRRRAAGTYDRTGYRTLAVEPRAVE